MANQDFRSRLRGRWGWIQKRSQNDRRLPGFECGNAGVYTDPDRSKDGSMQTNKSSEENRIKANFTGFPCNCDMCMVGRRSSLGNPISPGKRLRNSKETISGYRQSYMAYLTPHPEHAMVEIQTPPDRPKSPADYRRDALKRAEGYVCRDRQNSYGDAEDNFKDIADRWTIYMRTRFGINIDIKNFDVAAMMIDVKLARIASTHTHMDNWDDAIGYAACGAGIMEKKNAS